MAFRAQSAAASVAFFASPAIAGGIPEPALADTAASAVATVVDGRPLEQIIVMARHYENGIGTSDAASAGEILSDLIEERPALRPGEVLEFVPGMIVTQHSGDGKANQYFLRGFNLDHGTDFAT